MATTDLAVLIALIHPTRTYDRLARLADEALVSFTAARARPKDYVGFLDEIIRLFHHLEAHLHQLRQPVRMPPGMALSRCMAILQQIYGPSGDKTACLVACSGNEGGLIEVNSRFAHQVAENYAVAETQARVRAYWNRLSVSEKFAAGEEFVAKYGENLPQELVEGGAIRIFADLPGFLEAYPKLARGLGQALQFPPDPHGRPDAGRSARSSRDSASDGGSMP